MWKAGCSCILFLSLVIVFGVYGQSLSECPNLTQNPENGFNCTTAGCINMTCQLPSSSSLNGTSATITLDPCDDPPLITFTYQYSLDDIMAYVGEDTTIVTEEFNISVFVQRNATAVSFSAIKTGSDVIIFPLTVYSINTTDCQCNSLRDLAAIIQSPIEHDCSATPDCDGVNCVLVVFGSDYHVEIDVLPCEEPPSADVIMTDSSGTVVFSNVFNSTGVYNGFIFGLPVQISLLMIQHDYSIETESNLTVPFFGQFNMFPRHSVILDRTSCPSEPTVPTVSPSPPPTVPPPPPPADFPELSLTLYNLSTTAMSAGLICVLTPSYTELSCETEDGLYQFTMLFLPREYEVKVRVEYQSSQVWEVGVGEDQMRTFNQPDTGGYLTIEADATSSSVTLRVMVTADGQDVVLIPTTLINLPSSEGCLNWVTASYNISQCTYLLNCGGIQCYSFHTIRSASISLVEQCSEMLTIQLALEDFSGNTTYRNISRRGYTSFDIQGYNMGYNMGYMASFRSDTALNVTVETTSESDASVIYRVVPKLTIPLNCSCPSIVELAKKAQSPDAVEHDCSANEACDGVRCEFEALGQVFRLETILLSCNDPPALETVLENESNAPLSTVTMSQSGTYYMSIFGFQVPLYVDIVHYNYSMDVSVIASIGVFSDVTIVPPHTLFLDRTSCRDPVTAPPTTPTSPPTYPSSPATPICQSIVKFAMRYSEEPVVCRVSSSMGGSEECDILTCRLDVRSSSYEISVEIYPPERENVALVQVLTEVDKLLNEKEVREEGNNYDVQVNEGTLKFDFKTGDKALSIKVTFSPTGVSIETTIMDGSLSLEQGTVTPSTTPAKSSRSTSQGVKIGVPIVVIVVCIALVVVVVMVTLWLVKRRRHSASFEFKKFSDLKATEDVEERTKEEKKEQQPTSIENPYETIEATPLNEI